MVEPIVLDAKTFTYLGETFERLIVNDDTSRAPWEDSAGCGVVSWWRPKTSKAPWERVLSKDRDFCRFYDMRATREKAMKEGWGLPESEAKGLTKKQIIAEAIERDFRRLRSWCDDEWWYVGLVVRAKFAPGEEESVWGIESDCDDFIKETSEDLAHDLLRRFKGEMEIRMREVNHSTEGKQ